MRIDGKDTLSCSDPGRGGDRVPQKTGWNRRAWDHRRSCGDGRPRPSGRPRCFGPRHPSHKRGRQGQSGIHLVRKRDRARGTVGKMNPRMCLLPGCSTHSPVILSEAEGGPFRASSAQGSKRSSHNRPHHRGRAALQAPRKALAITRALAPWSHFPPRTSAGISPLSKTRLEYPHFATANIACAMSSNSCPLSLTSRQPL
jgi:hypothetical protein